MSKTLLLADDSVTIQKVVGISLASQDILLVAIDNGTEAVARAREVRPDIVLADVVMPGLSGYEVCQALKSDPEFAHVPVLLLTGTFEAFDEARAAEVGADDHITKPFEAQALVDKVNEHLARAASASAAPAPLLAAPQVVASAADPVPAEDPFDFFEEDNTEPGSGVAAAAAAEPARTTVVMSDELGIDAPADDVFDFDETAGDDLALPRPDEALPAADLADDAFEQTLISDRTQALMMGEAELEGAATLPPVEAPELELDEPDPQEATRVVMLEPEAPEAPDVPEATDLDADFSVAGSDDDLGDPLSGIFDAAGQASEPVLDPLGARDYDVSSSDLGDAITESPSLDEVEPTAAEETVALAEPIAAEERESPLWPEPEPLSEAEPALEAAEEPAEEDPAPLPEMEPIAAFAQAEALVEETNDPLAEPETPDDRSWLESMPMIASAEPTTDAEAFTEPEAELEVEPIAGEPIPAALPIAAAGGEFQISTEMRQEIRDTLEKITWEAFGDIAERIVAEALERVEQVAWEAIPRMAETLIQEEIRRLKEED